MFKKDKGKEKNRLTKLLESNPNAPLKTVLVNPDLAISLRNEVPALFDYFLPENKDRTVLKELIAWALTDLNNQDEKDFIYNRNATNVLTCVSRKFHKALYEDGTLDGQLAKFIDNTRYNESPSFSGQYSSILLQHSRQTDFQFFKDKPNFYKKILEHIQLLSYQRTLIEIISDKDVLLSLNANKVIIDLADCASKTNKKEEEITHGIFSSVDTILTESSDEIIEYFTKNEEFLKKMVSAALKLEKSHVIIDAFRTLDKLFKQVEYDLKDKITLSVRINFKELIRSSKKNDFTKAILYYPIFWKQGIEVMTDYFLQDIDKNANLIPNSKFCRSYVNVFKQMPLEERYYYVKQLNLVNRLSILTNKIKFNGLIYKLIKALSRPPKKEEVIYLIDPEEIHPFNGEEWGNLVMKYAEYFDELKIEKYKQVGFEKKKSTF